MFWGWVWAGFLIALFVAVLVAIYCGRRKCSSGKGRGRHRRQKPCWPGPCPYPCPCPPPTGTAPTGNTGPTLDTMMIFSGSLQDDVSAFDNNVGSLIGIGSPGAPITLDPDDIADTADGVAFIASRPGFLSDMHVFFKDRNGSQQAGTASATVYRTQDCQTGFAPTSLAVSWDVQGGLAGPFIVCGNNTIDQVQFQEGDRWVIVYSIVNAVGGPGNGVATIHGPSTVSFRYTFT